MAHFMLKLDGVLRRRRWIVLGAWIAAVVVALPFAARRSDHLTGGGYGVPGSQSQRATDALARDWGGRAEIGRSSLAVVVRDPGQLAAVQRATRAVPRVAMTRDAKRAALARVEHGRTTLVPLAVAAADDEAIDVAVDLREQLPHGTRLVGQGALWAGLQERSKQDLSKAEGRGFPIVAIVLLLVFGSLAAASLPLALGFVSVIVTGALIYWLSRATEMSVFVTNMASMIGIGVAVDYSLFILARYREEIRAGLPPDRARANALATSGLAVAFSGATVMVSLAGLFLVDTTAIRSMALGAILVVAVSVLAACTLLPVLMGLLGKRAYARGRWFQTVPLVLRSWSPRRRGGSRRERVPFWERWTAFVMHRPVVALVAGGSLLVTLAVPALALRTDDGALRQLPRGDETRQAFEEAAKLGGAGASSPLRIVSPAGVDVRGAVARDPEIARVGAPVRAPDGRSVHVTAIPRHDGESPQVKAAVKRLRAQRPARVDVGGASAAQLDFNHAVSGSMWKIALFVLALSYIVLLVLLRSAILPLKAALMNLLTVGAAYGVLVAAYQWGWLGFEKTGHLDTISPALVLAVVFGLSMDYEVFLLTRIRERYEATGDTRRAVAEGLATSARTITSAALIMVAVFATFAATGLPAIQQLGLGCAVAVALDATVVRLVLVPAAMKVLGRWNWWLPRPLGRVLPQVAFERLPAGASGD